MYILIYLIHLNTCLPYTLILYTYVLLSKEVYINLKTIQITITSIAASCGGGRHYQDMPALTRR